MELRVWKFEYRVCRTFQDDRRAKQIKAEYVPLETIQLLSEIFFRNIRIFAGVATFPVNSDTQYRKW